jgi:hypothetical protein
LADARQLANPDIVIILGMPTFQLFLSFSQSLSVSLFPFFSLSLTLPLFLLTFTSLLVGNKSDLDSEREVTFLEASRFAQENGLSLRDGMKEIFLHSSLSSYLSLS